VSLQSQHQPQLQLQYFRVFIIAIEVGVATPNNLSQTKTLTIVKVLYAALINQYFLITYV